MGSYKKNTTKAEKVKYLNNLLSGKVSIEDAPVNFPLEKADVWFSINGDTLQNQKTGEIITREEFEFRARNKTVITFK